MRNKFFAALVVVSYCFQSVNAEIAVIVHPSNQQALSDIEVKNLLRVVKKVLLTVVLQLC